MTMHTAGVSGGQFTTQTGTTGGAGPKHGGQGNWFEAIADAWGRALDAKVGEMVELATGPNGLTAGNNQPSVAAELTAKALEFGFLSNACHTQLTAIGSGLEANARKG